MWENIGSERKIRKDWKASGSHGRGAEVMVEEARQ